MLYTDGEFSYTLNNLIWKHSEEWAKILTNVLTVQIVLLANSNKRMKLKEVDIHASARHIVADAIPIFDKFLTEVKGYDKRAVIDAYDGSDIDLYQDLNYDDVLDLFKNTFTDMEVK